MNQGQGARTREGAWRPALHSGGGCQEAVKNVVYFLPPRPHRKQHTKKAGAPSKTPALHGGRLGEIVTLEHTVLATSAPCTL